MQDHLDLIHMLQVQPVTASQCKRGAWLQTFMNADGVGEVALAGATSNLFATLAESYRRAKKLQPGDEIVIHDASHEVSVMCQMMQFIASARPICPHVPADSSAVLN